MPAGPAPTMARRSLVMERSLVSSAGPVGDGLREAREALTDGSVGKGREGVDRLARPRVGEVEGGLCRLVLAQLGERGVEEGGIPSVGDARDAVVDALPER